MTNILAIDTATPRVSVALAGDGGVRAAISVDAGRRHGETLAPGIAYLTEAAGVPLAELDAVAVDVGPGLFTGLRVGLATAKSLASALEIPVAVSTSLDLLAHAARTAAAGRPVAAVVDARRGEVFWAFYGPGRGLDDAGRVHPPRVGPPDAAAAWVAGLAHGADLLVAGDGALRYADRFAVAGAGRVEVAGPGLAFPDAAVLAGLAEERLAAGGVLAASDVHAFYLRHADVRIGWERRDAPLSPTPSLTGNHG